LFAETEPSSKQFRGKKEIDNTYTTAESHSVVWLDRIKPCTVSNTTKIYKIHDVIVELNLTAACRENPVFAAL
jgi:hypothetical protein